MFHAYWQDVWTCFQMYQVTYFPAVPQSSQQSFSSTISSFESLNLSAQNGMNQNIPLSLRPNPTAREFVPRNQSAPNLHVSQVNAATSLPSSVAAPSIPGIKEFIPSSRLSQISSRQNGVVQQQPTSYMSSQQQRFMSQGSIRAMGDQEIIGMNKSNSPMGDVLAGESWNAFPCITTVYDKLLYC